MSAINVKGLREIDEFLKLLPAKVEANVLRGALRAGAKVIAEAAKTNAPSGEPSLKNKIRYNLYSGALRDSIRVSTRIDRRNGKVKSNIRVGGKSRKTGADVFYARFVEYGTASHSTRKGGKGEKKHPGIAPRPFLRPAADTQASAAVKAVGEYMQKRLKTKHGMNIPDLIYDEEE